MQRTASSSSSGILSLFVAMSKSSARGPRSKSSSMPRLRRRPRRVSSRSSRGSEEREALGVDFPDAGLLSDRVLRSGRPALFEEAEDWCD